MGKKGCQSQRIQGPQGMHQRPEGMHEDWKSLFNFTLTQWTRLMTRHNCSLTEFSVLQQPPSDSAQIFALCVAVKEDGDCLILSIQYKQKCQC